MLEFSTASSALPLGPCVSKLIPTVARHPAITVRRKYPCGIGGCTASFKLEKDLVRHRHRTGIHQSPRSFFCNVKGCESSDKGFSRKDNLDRHMRSRHRGMSMG